jgi:hypothetical protein
MFIWTGINVEKELSALKELKEKIERNLGITDTVVNLPLHVSLRISSSVSDEIYPSLENALIDFLRTVKLPPLEPTGFEREGGIVWLCYKESEKIKEIHDSLCALMEERFSIPRHPFDFEFKYHTTLFTAISEDKLAAAYDLVKDAPIPDVITSDRILIGNSESGKAGEYKVIHDIEIG